MSINNQQPIFRFKVNDEILAEIKQRNVSHVVQGGQLTVEFSDSKSLPCGWLFDFDSPKGDMNLFLLFNDDAPDGLGNGWTQDLINLVTTEIDAHRFSLSCEFVEGFDADGVYGVKGVRPDKIKIGKDTTS